MKTAPVLLCFAAFACAQEPPPPRLVASPLPGQEDLSQQLLTVKRVYVDRLTGGETAAQMRDLVIASLNNAKLFILTENQERADTIMRGAAEDLIFTDQFQSSDGIDMRESISTGSRGSRTGKGISAGVGDRES